eukprot:scaffold184001_cov32-Prasinocladus_malaysianus.AAC.1
MQLYHMNRVKPKYDMPSTDPTEEELGDVKLACSKLWDLDINRLTPGADYKLNVGGGKLSQQKWLLSRHIWSKEDAAEAHLFEFVDERIWNKDTFRAFMRLLDNYEASTQVYDRLSSSEVRESYEFLEEIMEEPVMQYVHKVTDHNSCGILLQVPKLRHTI